jgi:TolB-like protein
MRTRTEHYYLFGPFRLEPEECRLLRDGLVVPLTPKCLEMLLMLVRNADSLIEKDLLMRQLWPDTFVEESNLTFNISVIRKALGETAQTAVYIETVPKRGYRFVAPLKEVCGKSQIKSLAVLPFVNLSGREEGKYLTEGIQDALISELAHIASLRVISRTSSSQYTAEQPLSDFARTLQLDVAVEGSLLVEGNRLRLNVGLIDAVNDRHLWSQSYVRHLGDVLVMQSEVAACIVQQIEVKLTASDETRLAKTRSINPDAHTAYLKGRYYWHQFFTEAGMKTAIEHYQRAIDIEPNYAVAWAGLSACFTAMAVQSMLPPMQAEAEAKDAAKRALVLDPTSADVNVMMAATYLFFDWNWTAVERALQRALELSPSCEGHSLFTHYALARGWGEQAIAAQRRALDLDPMSAAINADLAWAHLLNRDYDMALEAGLSMERMQFNYPLTHVYLCQAYLAIGQHDDAIREIEKVVPNQDESPGALLAMLGHTYGVAEKHEAAASVLRRMEDLSRRTYVASYDWAVLYAGLNDKTGAIERLQRSVHDREPRVIWLNVDPAFDGLRQDKRIHELVHTLQLA